MCLSARTGTGSCGEFACSCSSFLFEGAVKGLLEASAVRHDLLDSVGGSSDLCIRLQVCLWGRDEPQLSLGPSCLPQGGDGSPELVLGGGSGLRESKQAGALAPSGLGAAVHFRWGCPEGSSEASVGAGVRCSEHLRWYLGPPQRAVVASKPYVAAGLAVCLQDCPGPYGSVWFGEGP